MVIGQIAYLAQSVVETTRASVQDFGEKVVQIYSGLQKEVRSTR